MLIKINTHSLGSTLVLTNSFEGTSIGRVDQSSNKNKSNSRGQENISGIIQSRNIFDAQCSISDTGGISNDNTNYFGKAQGCNSQIVAFEAQNRCSDKKSYQSRQ